MEGFSACTINFVDPDSVVNVIAELPSATTSSSVPMSSAFNRTAIFQSRAIQYLVRNYLPQALRGAWNDVRDIPMSLQRLFNFRTLV